MLPLLALLPTLCYALVTDKSKIMHQIIKKSILIIPVLVIFIFVDVLAQCPMCRAAAEQNLASGGEAARGLNNGILYLLVTPYLIVGLLGIIWYYRHKKLKMQNN